MAALHKRIRHPYHLKKAYIHWRLRLLRHPHSLKRVHYQHTSYPLLALLLLGLGAVLLNSTVGAYAATTDTGSVVVSATVMGVPPDTAATITAPLNGMTFTTSPITVTGSCPNKTYVQLFRNNYASGTAFCTSNNTYSIQTDLFEGANQLIVLDYNYADQAGPESSPVTVTYAPPVSVPPITGSSNTGSTGSGSSGGSSGTSSPNGTSFKPLTLHNNFRFQGFIAGTQASWQVAVGGGVAPYSVSVAWGDGQTALYTSKDADTLTLTHTYSAPGPTDGSYQIIITTSDAAGNHTTLQVVALVTEPVSSTGSNSGSSNGGAANGSGGTTIFGTSVLQDIGYLWSLYGILCVVLLSFWLGERRELSQIKANFRLTKL